MFDSLREQSISEPPLDAGSSLGAEPSFDASPAPAPTGGVFLGLTAAQRLIIAVLLMLSVCVLGTMCLMISGRIGLG